MLERHRNRVLPPISAETRQKMSIAQRGKKRAPYSALALIHIREAAKTRVVSPESRTHQRELMKALWANPLTRPRMSLPPVGQAGKNRRLKP